MVDYYKRVESAIDFMESRLTEKISVEDVSARIFSSKWHFQRIFRTMTGISLYSYLRKRRLSEAAKELLFNGSKVIDVAIKYCYGTPETFLREFKKEYRILPSKINQKIEHLFFDRIDIFQDNYRDIFDKEGISWKTIIKKETSFIGKKYPTTMQGNKSYADIPQIWEKSYSRNILNDIPGKCNENRYYGVYTEWDLHENFNFLVGTIVNNKALPPAGYARHTLGAGKYAKFTIYGSASERIINGWKYIYGCWFANTGHEHGGGDDFDLFDERFFNSDQPCSEIYISIK